MNKPRLHSLRMDSASLLGIRESVGFQSYIHTNRNNSDGTHAQIVARGVSVPAAYDKLFNRLFGIESFESFCAQGGELMPSPSQAAH